ncbi:MAG: hypothetical protein OHK0011_14710 [Turneriella sp.]
MTSKRLGNSFALYGCGYHEACTNNIFAEPRAKVEWGKTGHLPKTAGTSARTASQGKCVIKKIINLRSFTLT